MNDLKYNSMQKYGRRTDMYTCHDCFLKFKLYISSLNKSFIILDDNIILLILFWHVFISM